MTDTQDEYEEVEYMREGVNLLVETKDDEMVVSHSDLSVEQTIFLVSFLIEKFSDLSGIPYNEVLEDLKYKEEEESK